MSMSSNDGQRVTKAKVEADVDQGLFNLVTDETVFYVGGYADTFKVMKLSGSSTKAQPNLSKMQKIKIEKYILNTGLFTFLLLHRVLQYVHGSIDTVVDFKQTHSHSDGH